MSLEDPDFDFVSLVVTIGTSAQANLGEIPDFRTGRPKINLALARSNINMLSSLKRKTEGRLSAKEQKVLVDFIEDLQAKYMESLRGQDRPAPKAVPAAAPPAGSMAEKMIELIRQKRKEQGEEGKRAR